MAKHQTLDYSSCYIKYGIWPQEGAEIGFGPMGEGYVGLQLETIYEFFRARPLLANHRTIFGTDKNNFVYVWIEKTDDGPTQLTVRLFPRMPGDYHPQKVFLTSPDGKAVELTAGMTFPTIVDAGGGAWVIAKEFISSIDGWPCAQKTFPFEGKAGRYLVSVYGYKPCVHGPIYDATDWQDLSKDEWQYVGQDSAGEWPAGSVLVCN